VGMGGGGGGWKREVGVVFWESMVLEFEQLCVTGSFHVAKLSRHPVLLFSPCPIFLLERILPFRIAMLRRALRFLIPIPYSLRR